jgi:hypothetical protein
LGKEKIRLIQRLHIGSTLEVFFFSNPSRIGIYDGKSMNVVKGGVLPGIIARMTLPLTDECQRHGNGCIPKPAYLDIENKTSV